MNQKVDEIKRKIDIVDFIGSYIQLKRAGRNFKAVCPFHQEKSPSFVVSPDRQIWHCFGACHDGGDIFKFQMKWDNSTFAEALKDLAGKAGVTLEVSAYEDAEWKKKEQLLHINNIAKQFFQYILLETPQGTDAREYLHNRQLNEKIVKKFELGYASSSWDLLARYFKKKNISLSLAEELGLIGKRSDGTHYDRFRDRIMFPIKDAKGNCIGFSGRIMTPNDKVAKYINTPETPLYHKRETLYGIDVAKEAIKKEDRVIVVEGEFDMISPYQAAYENIVAIKGSAVTKEQLLLLKRYTNRMVLALDSDAAGEDAARRAIEAAQEIEFEINVATFSFAKDPDEAVQKDRTAFKKSIDDSQPIYDFIITASLKRYNLEDPYAKKAFADEVGNVLRTITNPIIRSFYTKKVAKLLEVAEQSIEENLRYIQYKRKVGKPDGPAPAPISRIEQMEKFIIGYLIHTAQPELRKQVIEILQPEDFSVPALSKLREHMVIYLSDDARMEDTMGVFPVELQSVIDELYLLDTGEMAWSDEKILRAAYEIKRDAVKRHLSSLLTQTSQTDGENGTILALQSQLNQVEKSLKSL